jgi:hypothetical protein
MKKNKPLSIHVALELIRNGQALVKTHTQRGPFWVVYPNGGEVSKADAERLLCRNDIQPSEDGLLPGNSQTFKFLPREKRRA